MSIDWVIPVYSRQNIFFQKFDIYVLNCFEVVTYFSEDMEYIARTLCFRRIEPVFQNFLFFRQNLVKILEVDTLVFIIVSLAIRQCAARSSTWITHNFPERRKPRKQKETHAPSLPPFRANFRLVYSTIYFAVFGFISFFTPVWTYRVLGQISGNNILLSSLLWREI